jgi:hypothetical protein
MRHFWLMHQQGALPEVIEAERWKYEGEPAAADWPSAEVAHVSIQGLTTRHGKEDAA